MVFSIKLTFRRFFNKVINLFDELLKSDRWIIYSVLLCTFVSLFFAFPSYDSIDPTYRRLSHFIEQCNSVHEYWLAHPISNINYRITVPIIINILNASYVEAFLIQYICGVLLFLISIKLIYKFTNDKISALLFSLALALSYPGITSFCELRGIFDGVAIFLVVLTLYLNNPILIISTIVLGSFTDERAFFASGFLLAYGIVAERGYYVVKNRKINKYNLFVILGLITYLVIRYIITIKYGLTMQDQHDLGVVGWKLLDQINNIPIAIWTGLEGLWILPLVCIIYTFEKKNLNFNLFYIGTLIFLIILGNSIVDTTRGLIYIFPSTLVAMRVISKTLPKQEIRYILMVCFMICLIWPAYGVGGKSSIWWNYPFPMQILRWIFLF